MPDFELMHIASVHRERVAARRLAQREGISLVVALERVLMACAGEGSLTMLLEMRSKQALRLNEMKQQNKLSSQQKHRAQVEAKQIARSGWCGWFDGSAKPNPGVCSIGAVLLAPDGRRWEISRTIGFGNSSTAEYEALLALLALMHEQDCTEAMIYGDSRVVIDDLDAPATKSAQSLVDYRHQAETLLRKLPKVRIVWIPRAKNHEADALAELAFARNTYDMKDASVKSLAGKF
ncbi:ribonuclease HI family protein [Undibacterium flavidum]|uniref:Ribonuclease HI family protein n=1 Tax=Undibacterium flavidum TaxID=2762297 RepID=A0ABR6Y868_9BURK|nr:ribonuclease HI family protein [Undibacterium flavidum]MBC3872806.1 ribonuclease HI family protein [Undibacterium flavidum]